MLYSLFALLFDLLKEHSITTAQSNKKASGKKKRGPANPANSPEFNISNLLGLQSQHLVSQRELKQIEKQELKVQEQTLAAAARAEDWTNRLKVLEMLLPVLKPVVEKAASKFMGADSVDSRSPRRRSRKRKPKRRYSSDSSSSSSDSSSSSEEERARRKKKKKKKKKKKSQKRKSKKAKKEEVQDLVSSSAENNSLPEDVPEDFGIAGGENQKKGDSSDEY